MKKLIIFLLALILPTCSLLSEDNIDPKAQEILEFWFGKVTTAEDFPKDKIILWFGKKDHIDRGIRNQYEYLVQAASHCELDDWKATPKGRLALIILLDQFPRNIYRDTAQAFAFDKQALQLTLEGLKNNEDNKLLPIERAFFYMPLMHAENPQLQMMSVEKYRMLVPSAPANLRSNYKSYQDYALRHYDIIMRFGRFPHRNAQLCRESTPEENEFLKTPGSTF